MDRYSSTTSYFWNMIFAQKSLPFDKCTLQHCEKGLGNKGKRKQPGFFGKRESLLKKEWWSGELLGASARTTNIGPPYIYTQNCSMTIWAWIFHDLSGAAPKNVLSFSAHCAHILSTHTQTISHIIMDFSDVGPKISNFFQLRTLKK